MSSFPRLSSDWERLLALDEASLDRRVLELLASNEGSRTVDVDHLMGFGVGLVRAGKEGKDQLALTWLAKAQTSRRLDIVSAFLGGYWQPAVRRTEVPPQLVQAFINFRTGIKTDDEVSYSSLIPLAQIGVATAPIEVRHQVKRALHAASGDVYREPQMREQARRLISRTLERLG